MLSSGVQWKKKIKKVSYSHGVKRLVRENIPEKVVY